MSMLATPAVPRSHTIVLRTRRCRCSNYQIAEEESPNGPRVSIVHIRHASRAPLAPEEASEMKAGR